jgi:endonuclease YncB( thermonuclease family)
MPKVQLFWDPEGRELNSLGTNKFLRITDGDTPYISTAIRMLSIDTPEVHYPGNSNPAKHDAKFQELHDWVVAGQAPVSDALAAHLRPRLSGGGVGTRQKAQGEAATAALDQLMAAKLAKPNGSKRELYVATSHPPFEQYGRLLAYIAPYYAPEERDALGELDRATFNLLMIDGGWAAPFPIFPGLPKYRDLVLMRDRAADAFNAGRGIWSDPATLTGYEFRMTYRLWDITRRLVKGERLSSSERRDYVERYCVDMTTREIFEPGDYHRVAPYNRVFIWPADVTDAVARLNLTPPN